MSQLSIAGERVSGQEVRTQNVMAALSVANVVKSSLGPVGLDKMLVDDLGEVTITNDGATILDQLEVEHPAAKVLVQLSEMQDKEVGDGTTSVVILAAELLKRGNELIKDSIHATSVMAGFRLAMKESIKFIRDQMVVKTDKLGRDIAFQIAKTTLASKIFGRESDFFANLAVDAMAMVKDVHPESGKAIYPIKSVGILKQHGGSARDSQLISGYVLPGGRAAQGMPRSVKGAKIALLDIDLRKTKMAMGVSVVVTDPKKLEEIRKREADITKERIQLLINAGVSALRTTTLPLPLPPPSPLPGPGGAPRLPPRVLAGERHPHHQGHRRHGPQVLCRGELHRTAPRQEGDSAPPRLAEMRRDWPRFRVKKATAHLRPPHTSRRPLNSPLRSSLPASPCARTPPLQASQTLLPSGRTTCAASQS